MPDVATSSAEVIARITNVEQAIHRGGWDEPPSLHMLYGAGNYRVPGSAPNPAGAQLERLSYALDEATQPAARLLLAQIIARDPLAVMFVCEAWMNSSFASDEERQQDGRNLADIPGSVEARQAMAVALDGHLYALTRVRGQKPVVEDYSVGHERRPTGRVPEALERIAAAIEKRSRHVR